MIQDWTITSQHLESQLLKTSWLTQRLQKCQGCVIGFLKPPVLSGRVCADTRSALPLFGEGNGLKCTRVCELGSQAAVKESLWGRKMMCFPAKWLPVSEHRATLESKMVLPPLSKWKFNLLSNYWKSVYCPSFHPNINPLSSANRELGCVGSRCPDVSLLSDAFKAPQGESKEFPGQMTYIIFPSEC